MIGGVAAGLADYAGIDITLARLLFVVATLFQGSGLLAYVILWIAMPAGSTASAYSDYSNAPDRSDRDATGPPQGDFAGSPGQPPTETKRSTSNSTALIGWILVGFGVYFLGREFLQPWFYQFFYWFNFSRIWPVVFIIVGILIVTSASRKQASSGPPPTASAPPDAAPPDTAPATSGPPPASPGSVGPPLASPATSAQPPSSTLPPPAASTESGSGDPSPSSTLPPPASPRSDDKAKPE